MITVWKKVGSNHSISLRLIAHEAGCTIGAAYPNGNIIFCGNIVSIYNRMTGLHSIQAHASINNAVHDVMGIPFAAGSRNEVVLNYSDEAIQ